MKIKRVAVIMGSQSDYPTLRHATKILKTLKINFDTLIVSAHRTPDRLFRFAKTADKKYEVVIAGAGGSAHLPGMVASLTTLPVLGVPIESKIKRFRLTFVYCPNAKRDSRWIFGYRGKWSDECRVISSRDNCFKR